MYLYDGGSGVFLFLFTGYTLFSGKRHHVAIPAIASSCSKAALEIVCLTFE
jgi:hypothetical protein